MSNQVTVGATTSPKASRTSSMGFGRQVRMAWAMTVSEWRLLLREPSAFFFTLVFPILLLLVFGGIFGNDPADGFDGVGPMDRSVPAYCVLIIGTLAIFNIPIQLAAYRENGVLRRLQATPIRAWMIFGAQLAVGFAVTALGTLLMLLIGVLVFDLNLPERPFATALALVMGVIGFASAGFVIAALCRTSRQVQLVANFLYFPQLFLSGASLPRNLFPNWLERISEWLPLTQLTILVQDLWVGDGWRPSAIIYLVTMTVIGLALSIRLFRWEK